ncbi:MAG: hypothetical protein ACK6BG_00235 [Cyanobacteriota bacterium]
MVPSASRALPVALSLVVLGTSPGVARAELPPWVYGDQQRRAPVVVKLRILQAERSGSEARVRGEVRRVWRQPDGLSVKAGQTIDLRYALAVERPPGWVGPSALPLPQKGEVVNAWLKPIPGTSGRFAPAAEGRSFGPSMEAFQEP